MECSESSPHTETGTWENHGLGPQAESGTGTLPCLSTKTGSEVSSTGVHECNDEMGFQLKPCMPLNSHASQMSQL